MRRSVPFRTRGEAVPATRLRGLDTLRAAAILLVMPFHLSSHLPAWLQPLAHFGWAGVDLFFVLSGFLIAGQLLAPYGRGERPDLGAFYRRRAFRILPAYFAVLLLYVLWPLWREAPGMQPPWQFVTFTENLLIDYRVNHAFSHAWSLCVEEHFYLVLPVLVLWAMRRPSVRRTTGLLVGVLVLGAALRTWVLLHTLRPMGPESDDFGYTYFESLYYPTWVRLDGLTAGVALALVRQFRPRWWAWLSRQGHATGAFGAALVGLVLWCSVPRLEEVTGRAAFFDLAGYPLLGLGFALLIASAVSRHGLLARLRVPGARGLATLSFSLYLTHKEAVHLLYHWFPAAPEGDAAAVGALLGVTLLAGALLYLCVERPFLLLRDWHGGARQKLTPELEAKLDPAL